MRERKHTGYSKFKSHYPTFANCPVCGGGHLRPPLMEEFEAGFVDNFGMMKRKYLFGKKTKNRRKNTYWIAGEDIHFCRTGNKHINVYLELLREFIKRKKNKAIKKLQRLEG